MTLDELINKLQNAKDHCVEGNREVTICAYNAINRTHFYDAWDVVFDNKNISIITHI